ncbi:glycosyltransferase [Xenorhabdus griffiniae]|uniref:glycosyltransferase n=1 Tax=Xenorhabdus griffiniae TaxID=351672 RepID=UPI002359EBF2|nr:glycosyltransferase [Xenorhabdus griffiniae]MDC9603963.1 glycosyltransferase [Xenorhabdus griffiniae]
MASWSNLDKLKLHYEFVYSIHINRTHNDKVDYNIKGNKNKLLTALSNLLLYSGRMNYNSEKKILKIIKEINPTIVYLDSSYLGRLSKLIKKHSPSIKIISFFHNIELDFEINRLKSGQIYFLPSFLSAIYNEKLAVKYSDAIIALHESDSQRCFEIYGRSADYLLPISLSESIGVKNTPTTSYSKREKPVIGFIGTAFYANIEAVKYIVNNIANEIHDADFIIVGRGFENYKNKFERDNVKVIGSIDSIPDFYKSVDFILSPVFTGAGMKVKIAEALAYNKLIIASSFSLIGYEKIVDNKAVISCVNKNDFIKNIKLTLSKIKESGESDFNSRIKFEKFYSGELLAYNLKIFIDGLLDKNYDK